MITDLVITYVDNSNKEWQEKYIKVSTLAYSMYYRTGKDVLKYLLRSVDKNLPFVNNVFLIVQNTSEVPEYIDTSKVRVITHEEFIPAEFLPTFNSNTIETFFGNIEGLSEHFLYMNDDMFILNELCKSNFYTEDDKAISYQFPTYFENGVPSNFEELLIHDSELVYGISRQDAIKNGYTVNLNHTIRPYFKSIFNDFYNKHQDIIYPTITPLRSKNNFSIYAVDLYQHKLGLSENSRNVSVRCIENNISSREIEEAFMSDSDTLCIYDIDERVNMFENPVFQKCMLSTFPNPSKYEK